MSYELFSDLMAESYPQFNWEPLTVTTSDNYILTLMHVWHPENRDSGKGPVMFQHGAGGYAPVWIQNPDTAYPIKLADEGHDVYIGSSRGTEYSQGHVTLDPAVDEEEYWNFSFQNLADDVFANLKEMYVNSGTGKGWYFGHSQGTASIQVALSKYDNELSQYLNRVVLMAPCAYLTLGQDSDEADLS